MAKMHCTPIIVRMATERWPKNESGSYLKANYLDVGCGTGVVAKGIFNEMNQGGEVQSIS